MASFRVRVRKVDRKWKYFPEIWRWYWPFWCAISIELANESYYIESYDTEKEAWDIIDGHESGVCPDTFIYHPIKKEKK